MDQEIYLIGLQKLPATIAIVAELDTVHNKGIRFIYQGNHQNKRVICIFSLRDEESFDYALEKHQEIQNSQLVGIDKDKCLISDQFRHQKMLMIVYQWMNQIFYILMTKK